MIKEQVTKEVHLDGKVIKRLKKCVKTNNIEGFIKAVIDWMLEDGIKLHNFYPLKPEYEDEKGSTKYITVGDCCKCNYCKDITGLSEKEFCSWINENRHDCLYRHKGYIIRPMYSTSWTYAAGGYCYDHDPQFTIYSVEDVKEIEE